jgi:hypothetical protein
MSSFISHLLSFSLLENNPSEPIPRVVSSCITFLSTENALQTEGIFRRSANVQTVKEVQQLFNTGKEVDFGTFGDPGGVHVAAATLKSFLRELEEPILTFDLYDHVIDFQQLTSTSGVDSSRLMNHGSNGASSHAINGNSNVSHHQIEKLAVAKSLVCQRLPNENYVVSLNIKL